MAGASVAAKKAKAAGGGRKVRDKWKAKEWYKIHAPRMFNEAEIGETPSADPEYVIGRTVEVTVQDLTGDFSKMHIKLRFKVSSVDGHDAKTEFIGHDLTSDYVRRLTRRKKTKTDHVVDIVTKDGFSYRIKTMAIADKRIQSSQEDAMRRVIGETLVAMGQEQTLSQMVKALRRPRQGSGPRLPHHHSHQEDRDPQVRGHGRRRLRARVHHARDRRRGDLRGGGRRGRSR